MKKLKLILCFILLACTCWAPENPDRINQTIQIQEYIQQKHHESELERFLSHLAFRESSGNWKIYNRWGYLGLYQIGYSARIEIGYGHVTYRDFIQNPYVFPVECQREAIQLLIQHNVKRMHPYTNKYYLLLYGIDGQEINGEKLTLSGMIAGAHLAGPYGMKRYVESGGRYNPKDALGTRLSDYVREFSNYNLNLNQL